jgi:DNA-binding NarL/FixJ family response regulator
VLCLAATGKSVKQIAAELSLSPKTVSTFRSRILRKLGLSTHAEAMRYALLHGLVE